jgi:hypothetical protein
MGVEVTVIHVMYLMGDYRGSGPQHRVYRVVWPERMLEETWGMILRGKETVEKDEPK